MDAISILIILLFILLTIFVLRLVHCNEFNGGEYMSSLNEETGDIINPTISQICMEDYTNDLIEMIYKYIDGIESRELLFLLIEISTEKLKDRAKTKFNNKELIITGMTTMRTVSDAHIDLLGTLIMTDQTKHMIKNAYAVCEWSDSKNNIKGGQLMTSFERNKNGSILAISNDGIERIDKIIKGSNIRIFIEFTYIDGRSYDLYGYIHMQTSILLPILMEIGNSKLTRGITRSVIAIRLKIHKISQIDDLTKEICDKIINANSQYNNGKCNLIVYDESKYETIIIPNSNSLYNDEEIAIETETQKYSIQIEHSENGYNHKSNFIEFIARNINDLVSSEREMIDFLSLTSYKYMYFNYNTGKYDIEPENIKSISPAAYNNGNAKFETRGFKNGSQAFVRSFGKYSTLLSP